MPSRDASAAAAFVLPAIIAALVGGAASCQRDAHGRVLVRQGECMTCHESDYLGTAASPSPPHPDLGWVWCATCHTETAWIPAVPLQHEWFLLANRHATEPCTACHLPPGGFAPGATSSACVACHDDDYAATTMPPHGGALGVECASCHTDAGWIPSSFVHGWALDGAHRVLACTSCHGEPPVYAGTSTACADCHMDDRARAIASGRTDIPDHGALISPCGDCHTTTAWRPATGHPEPRFPIMSGPHAPFDCADCHDASRGSPVGGANTSCVGCHTGEHASEDGRHGDVAGYPTGSRPPNFCLECHPAGRR